MCEAAKDCEKELSSLSDICSYNVSDLEEILTLEISV